MRPSPPQKLTRSLLALLIALLGPSFFSCGDGLAAAERGPFGLERVVFADIVARNDKTALLALEPTAFDDPGPLGSPAWFFTAFWLERGGFEGDPGKKAALDSLTLELYGRMVTAKPSYLRDLSLERLHVLKVAEARRAQLGSPEAAAAWEALLASPYPEKSDTKVYRLERLEALAGLGRYAETLEEAQSLARGDLGATGSEGAALLYWRALAGYKLNREGWTSNLEALLREQPSPWLDRGLALALEIAKEDLAPPIDPLILATARLRVAVGARDYAAAYRLTGAAAPALRGEAITRELVATFAKAYLFSDTSREGLLLMDRLGATGGPGSSSLSPAWTAAFYKARMLRSLDRCLEAASLFSALDSPAIETKDRDSLIWYGLESRFRALDLDAAPEGRWVTPALRQRVLGSAKLALLVEASRSWSDGLAFIDLASPLLVGALASRNWDLVEVFALQLPGRLGRDLAARSLYLSARARELSLFDGGPHPPAAASPIGPPKASPPGAATQKKTGKGDEPGQNDEAGPAKLSDGLIARTRYATLLSLEGVSEYYRLVAAARLGRDLSPLDERSAPEAPIQEAASPQRAPSPELGVALAGLVAFGMPSLIWELAKNEAGDLDDASLRDFAELSSKAGRAYDSMRFAYLLLSRRGDANKGDLGLLYPRPYLPELRAAIADSDLPEALVLGLVRSESWFNPDIASRAGAIGLAQLMPVTASEIAAKLKLAEYDLTRPADNLRLGMTMFRDLMRENKGKALRAMFAYNAGRGRLKRWVAESGDLPDDLFLEGLGIEETRQYGRNIVTATAWYGALYYRRGTGDTVAELFEGIDAFR